MQSIKYYHYLLQNTHKIMVSIDNNIKNHHQIIFVYNNNNNNKRKKKKEREIKSLFVGS